MKSSGKMRQKVLLISAVMILLIILAVILFIGNRRDARPKVGLIITGSMEESGWNGAHYQGVRYACEQLDAELLVKENVQEGTGKCAEAIKELATEGAGMIILSSYAYPEEARDVIDSYPKIAFYGISAEYYADNMTSYFGRMYQARYLAGIVAGMKTESNKVGYVAAMPNSEVNRGINAFTLGVKKANPDAEVYVVWTNTWDDEKIEAEATNKLIDDAGVDIITCHQNQNYVVQTADKAGIYSIGYNKAAEGLSEKYLTAAVWNWNELYFQIMREYMQGKANSVKRHWFGINTEVVALADCSPLVEEDICTYLKSLKNELYAGKDVFSGVIYDNSGQLRCNEGESISDELLLERMDWYVDGVVIYE
ncbi:MAG: BMP family ABC transporter substrate-binding protein [Lachnospiraceae bacterium]|nr:BMP family ABC transporter substrate-binding protein [Lachnospiraceae bacterium]